MRVVVAFNDDADRKSHLNDAELAGEEEVIATAREVADTIGGELLPVRSVPEAMGALRRIRPDVVFNLCEGVEGRPRWEMHFALALEMLGVPSTSGDPLSLGMCGDKTLVKRLLGAAGVPVPRGFAVTDPLEVPAVEGTWIVKPSREDAGVGIDAGSVCGTREEIASRCRFVIDRYRQPALVEEFLTGREVNQAFFDGRNGRVILPPGEIVFGDELSERERIVGWKAKWAAGSREDLGTISKRVPVTDLTIQSDLSCLTLRVATVLSLHGYCRIDMRQRSTGELCILDVNPNPDIGAGAGFRKALEAAGIPFREFLTELMMAARSRQRPA